MRNKHLFMSGFAPLLLATSVSTALAQEGADTPSDADVEKIAVVGSRSLKERSVADSPVPVDLLDADALVATGGAADLTDNLKALVL